MSLLSCKDCRSLPAYQNGASRGRHKTFGASNVPADARFTASSASLKKAAFLAAASSALAFFDASSAIFFWRYSSALFSLSASGCAFTLVLVSSFWEEEEALRLCLLAASSSRAFFLAKSSSAFLRISSSSECFVSLSLTIFLGEWFSLGWDILDWSFSFPESLFTNRLDDRARASSRAFLAAARRACFASSSCFERASLRIRSFSESSFDCSAGLASPSFVEGTLLIDESPFSTTLPESTAFSLSEGSVVVTSAFSSSILWSALDKFTWFPWLLTSSLS
mmetsp:Transcript_27517/g.89630  ORF Transcript_27517/g.89630 Transcript_27517/m.89630 type:complete len:280 (-) Transcript_27517:2308-3147(-)